MSAHAADTDRRACVEAGMDGFVPKPVRRAALLDAVRVRLGPVPSALVVDDSEDLRLLVTRYLERDGWLVEEAENGEAALDAVRAGRPDVALLDLDIAGEDGVEVAGRLLSVRGDLQLIALTGDRQPESHSRCHDAGFGRVLVKPVGRDDLIAACRDAYERAALGATDGNAGPGRAK